MSTSPNTGPQACDRIELKDYYLKEMPGPRAREVEAHVRGCSACREELDRLQLTGAALFTLRDEEMPQRIAFVSDKVFEPSPWRRWWSAFWASSGRLGFASAVLLSAALVYNRVAPAPVAVPPVPVAAVQPVSDAAIQARVDAAVAQAAATIEARQVQKTAQLVADLEDVRKRLLLAAAEYDMSQRRSTTLRASAYDLPPLRGGEVK